MADSAKTRIFPIREFYLNSSNSERFRLCFFYSVLLCVQILDVIAVALLGVFTSAVFNSAGANSQPELLGSAITLIQNNLSIGFLSSSDVIVLSGIAIIVLLSSKTLIGFLVAIKIYKILLQSGEKLASSDLKKIAKIKPINLRRFEDEASNFALTDGYRLAHAGYPNAFFLATVEIFYISIMFLLLIRLSAAGALLYGAIFSIFLILQRLFVARKLEMDSIKAVDTVMYARRNWLIYVNAIKEIWFGNRVKYFMSKIGESLLSISHLNLRSYVLQQIPRVSLEFLNVLLIALLVVVIRLNNSGVDTVEIVAIFSLASARLIPSFARLQGLLTTMNSMAGGLNPFFDFRRKVKEFTISNDAIDETSFKTDLKNTRPEILFLNNIELEIYNSEGNVDFNLGPITVEMKLGETWCVRGPSGSGKTSLLDGLLGVREITKGNISWFGGDLSVNRDLCDVIAYVPQHPIILEDTVLQNILCGLDQDLGTEEKIRSILIELSLGHLLESDGGLDKVLGKRGIDLSGGEKQRIAIARALYLVPNVLVLDEATNALDSALEAKVYRFIRRSMVGKLLIYVTHNDSVVNPNDRLLILKDGKLI